jgi:trans-2,3-dihydro-3-hydroxyanthranilate isomerase
VALPTERAVAELRPDMARLADLGICANCFAGDGGSWKTRMFAPASGVAEDAATGSAAGPLALHLARHGRIAFGQEIEIRQGEEIDRPSLLHAKVVGTPERIESIEVGGSAQIVAQGRFRIGEG